jgi:membrane-bound ClpP family serine protease
MQNGVRGMIGDTALVVRPIESPHHPGLVRARGESWMAISVGPDEKIPAGSSVVVADVERGMLVVYPIEEPQ